MFKHMAVMVAIAGGIGFAIVERNAASGREAVQRHIDVLARDLAEFRSQARSSPGVTGIATPAGRRAVDASAPSRSDPAQPGDSSPSSPDVSPEVPPDTAVEHHLEATFVEDRSAAWSATALADVLAVVTEVLPADARVVQQDCRGSLCRLEIAHVGRDGHAQFIRSLMSSSKRWEGPMSLQRSEDGNGVSRTVVFLGEPGSDGAKDSVWR